MVRDEDEVSREEKVVTGDEQEKREQRMRRKLGHNPLHKGVVMIEGRR